MVGFSIVTVARNAAAHIRQCLESVAAQTYDDIEHVVVDGASTDGTQAIVTEQKHPAGQFVSEPDKGIYDAMNKGVSLATRDYVLFLGADDHLVDAKVIADCAKLLECDRPDWAYGDLEVRNANGSPAVFRPPPPEQALELMICGCLPHQSTFTHRRFFERIGTFDLRYQVQSDYDWFLRALGAEGATIRKLDRVIGSFGPGGVSSMLRKGQEETYAIQNAFPLYQQPAWMTKRLVEFQRQLLDYRIQLSAATSGNSPRSDWRRARELAARILRRRR